MLIGRENEVDALLKFSELQRAGIMVVYGRRRVGKTTLIESTFKNSKLIKIEGLEKKGIQAQIKRAKEQLSLYFPDSQIEDFKINSWAKFFKLLWEKCKKGKWIIFLEEFQWLANYNQDLTAELKYAFDNYFQKNPKIKIIICGSAPSFILKKVLYSKSLHNRALYQLKVEPFNLTGTKKMLGDKYSKSEAMDALLCVGGIPEYLIYLKEKSSILLSLAENSFKKDGFFVDEYERVAVSSLAKNEFFFKIIDVLAKKKYADRGELIKKLKTNSGSNFNRLLDDLGLCGFIEKYQSLQAKGISKSKRYRIADNYLQFFYKFIKPELNAIKRGDFQKNPLAALDQQSLQIWKGFAFERYCLRESRQIAELLGFSAVKYQVGTYFERGSESQIDLIFDRADKVMTVCEVKYTERQITKKIIPEFEKKLDFLRKRYNHSIQKVLISASGADKNLVESAYFEKVITLSDFV